MASFIIGSIHSALRDLASLQDKCPPPKYGLLPFKIVFLRQRLRNLITFLLCSRKLSNDAILKSDDSSIAIRRGSLESLIGRIADAVCRNRQNIHPYCLRLEDGFCMDVGFDVDNFQHDIECFEEEIDEWYTAFSDTSQQPSSPRKVIEIIDSVLVNFEEFLYLHMNEKVLVQLSEPLGEKMKFLRNFICFAMLLSAEHQQLEDLLAHIEAVAIDSAHLIANYTLTVTCIFNKAPDPDKKWWEGMPCKVSELLQRIKPINPCVCETYVRALTCLKQLGQLHAPTFYSDDDPLSTMKDFTDFLITDLWETLQLDTGVVASEKDRRQVLYEGLRSLRTSLKEQPNKFNEEIKQLTGVLICDAGVVIFSLHQKDINIDHAVSDLLGKMQVLVEEIEEAVPKTSTFNVSSSNGLGFVDFVLNHMMELTGCEAYADTKSQVQAIHTELAFLRSFLGDIMELRSEDEEFQALWNRIMEVAYRVEFLIDRLLLRDIRDSFSASFDSVMEDIKNIKTNVLKTFSGKTKGCKIKNVTQTSSQGPSQYIISMTDDVVGFHDEATSIIDRLQRGSKQLHIVAIVGMAGLGKTTLATKVYNDVSVLHHFHVRAWSTVSQVFDIKKVLLELLNHIVPDKSFEMDEQDLAEELRRRLKGRRYLIFLDDVWNIEAWNSLEMSLPNDSNGSRIILTSRLHDVAPHAMLDADTHCLRQLTNDESLELLGRKLFPETCWPPPFYEFGMQIADICKGLPLTIIIIAGLLANMEQGDWITVLQSLNSGIISCAEQCKNSMELSYKHLPHYLKPCFLYFGVFLEDEEVSVKRMIWLWISEGFVQKTELKSLEDVATNYMMDLIARSLVMVAKRRSIGGVKTCRVHDLLHEFCLTKAKEENYLQLLRGYDELLSFNEPFNIQRLCIYSKEEHFKESKIFCPRARSLLIFDKSEWSFDRITWHNRPSVDLSFIMRICKLLGVFHARQINLGSTFPTEMELLVQLRYLAFQGNMEVIPSSISKLSKLETFIMDPMGKKVSFPHTLWNLHKLRHIYIKVHGIRFAGCSLPIENLDNCPNLYELQSFCGAIISSWQTMENQMRKFPNIRKLKCRVFEHDEDDDTEDSKKIIVPEFLNRLESLDVSPYDIMRSHNHEFEFTFPVNLRKLTLSLFGLPWSKISTIGNLPNLEVLKLGQAAFSGETWEMEEGEFPKLRFLKLDGLDIVSWTASDDQLPNLEKLVLKSCYSLEEIPSYLENIYTLEMIEVSSCPECISASVQQIQDVQIDMGNTALKIQISHVIAKSS